ncbi:hypothetical protein [Salinibaculum salinum]|uniref:hypothetical protein n=1 Tax=Salinibaculum salinum TaxID=3131996 RepID=UPI0030EC73E0
MTEARDASDLISEEVGVRFEDNSVVLPTEKPATKCLIEVVELLVESGYITKSQLPIESGYKRYLLNSEDKHKESNPMARPKQIADDIYLETNYNNTEIKNKIKMLANMADN